MNIEMSELNNMLYGESKIIQNKIHNFTIIYSNVLRLLGPPFVISPNNLDTVYKETIKYINAGLPNVWGMYTIKEPESVIYNYRAHINSLFHDRQMVGMTFNDMTVDKILIHFPSFLIHLLLFESRSIRNAFVEDEASLVEEDFTKFRSNFNSFINIVYEKSIAILNSKGLQLDILPFDSYKEFTVFQILNIMNYERGLGSDNKISFLLRS